MNKMIALPATAATLALMLAGTASAQVVWEGTVGVDYSRGEYGGTTETEVLYVPIGVSASADRWRFDASVPWVRIDGPAGSVSGGIVIPGSGPAVRSEGLGDVVLGATYRLNDPAEGEATLELGGSVKIPTAEEGVGTDETDYNIFFGVRAPLGERLTFVGRMGYSVLGDPDAFELEDGVQLSAALNYRVSDRVVVGGQFAYREEYLTNLDAPASFSPYFRYDAEGGWSVTGYASTGLSDGAPEFGAGFVLGKTF